MEKINYNCGCEVEFSDDNQGKITKSCEKCSCGKVEFLEPVIIRKLKQNDEESEEI